MGTIAFNGLFIALISCISFFAGSFLEHGSLSLLPSDHGSSMVFLTMSMAEVFCAISMRSQKGSIFTLGTHNRWLWGASVLALGLTAFAIGVPFVATLFGFTKIGIIEVAIALGLAVTVIPATEIKKAISRKLA